MKKLKIFLVFLLFLTASTVRLYKLGNPVADWHSWRQADTAAVARNFLKLGFDPLRPRYDDLSNIQSGRDNPFGYRMVEFPLYQLIAAGLAKTFPMLTIEVWLRLVAIAASTASAVLLFLLVKRTIDLATGILAGFIYAVLPYSIYYGRAILPEGPMVFLSILSLYFLLGAKNAEHKVNWRVLALAGVCAAAALLIKPVAAFLLFPSAIYLLVRHFSISKNLFISLFIYLSIGLWPLVWWRGWISQFPEGIPVYTWLFNAGGIRFKGAWFYWLFAERLGKLILGYWGLIPLGLGLLVKPEKKEGWFFYWWLAGALAYLIVFAAGNVQHDYYQILLLPVISVYVAKGLVYLLTNRAFSRVVSYQLSVVSFFFMLAFSWYYVRTYYWINRPEIVEAGKLADQLLPKDAKVIAPYNGDTTFLYQTNRQGWPLGFDIEKKIAAGATHYVTVSPTDNDLETKDLAQRFRVLVRNDKYAIIDLTQKP